MESVLNETQVAEMLGVSLACVRRWRLLGEGPRYRKIGPLVRYRLGDVTQWFEKQPTGGDGHRLEGSRKSPSRSLGTTRGHGSSKGIRTIGRASMA